MTAVATATGLLFTAMTSCSSDIETPGSSAKENELGVYSVFGGVQEAKVQRAPAKTFQIGDYTTPTIKTSLDHATLQATKNPFFWEVGDNIWVKKSDRTYAQSNKNDIVGKAASANFYFSGLYEDASYPIFYTGNSSSSSATQVVIASTQTQSAANNTQHLGASGDCGYATATRNGSGIYEFSLEHKAAYVCVSPRMTDAALGRNVYVKKVKLTSAGTNIAGTFDFSTGELNTATVTDASQTIEINAGNGNGFPLTGTTSETALTNSSLYAVIAPGTHTLTVEYTIYDPKTQFEGKIVQELPAHNFAKNTVTDVVKDLNTDIYDLDAQTFYMWDAQKSYWDGVTGTIPKWNEDAANSEYPKTTGDPRFTNKTVGLAVNSGKNLPTVNELLWLAQRGDPHLENSSEIIFKANGHIKQGSGLWVKKKSKIENYSTTVAPDGTDKSQTNPKFSVTPKTGRPAKDVLANYFFLPAYGNYITGGMASLSEAGVYYSNYRTRGYNQVVVAFVFFGGKLYVNNMDDYRAGTLWTVQ